MTGAGSKNPKFLDTETFISTLDASTSRLITQQGGTDSSRSDFHPLSSHRALWRAVIMQAFQDALSNSQKREAKYEQYKARAWLLGMSADFITVCHYAEYDPRYVREKALTIFSRISAQPSSQKKILPVRSPESACRTKILMVHSHTTPSYVPGMSAA